jgi:hypothetical protein
LTVAEVAALTGEPRGRVQHHYYRAIEKLRASAREAEAVRGRVEKQEPVVEKTARQLPGAMNVSAEEVEIG